MVRLLISKLGNRIYNQTPEAIYERLKADGYLSDYALTDREGVISTLERVKDSWPSDPAIGAELWGSMQHALVYGGYLSTAGLEASKKYVSRR